MTKLSAYFDAFRSLEGYLQIHSASLISSEKMEKALFCDGKTVFLSDEGEFLKAHEAELAGMKETGIHEVGGQQVFIERLGRTSQMVICGAGHVAIPILKLAQSIGMEVTVIDDREEFAGHAREAGAEHVYAEPFADALTKIPGNPDTFFVIVTRGHKWDEDCLRMILKKPHAYIGMMGSKRRILMVKQKMIDEGNDAELVNSVYAPIGLDINSETPEEIAIAVLAQVIQVRNARKQYGYPQDILQGAYDHDGPKVLAEIVRRSGSAPREVGTKMMIVEDGSGINTIGGGLLESLVLKEAKKMLDTGLGNELFHDSLTADAASKEGEVCGGDLDVLLERFDG